jgi:hypothetical protein
VLADCRAPDVDLKKFLNGLIEGFFGLFSFPDFSIDLPDFNLVGPLEYLATMERPPRVEGR